MAVRSPVPEAVRTSRALSRAVDGLRFDLPVTHVYNPLRYARASHEEYLHIAQPARWPHPPPPVVGTTVTHTHLPCTSTSSLSNRPTIYLCYHICRPL